MTIETIVCCTDFSELAARARAQAAAIARLSGANLYVLHVVRPRPQVLRAGLRGKPVGERDRTKEVRGVDETAALSRVTSLHADLADVRFEPAVRYGHEAAEILRFADERDADLIVLGARGVGALAVLFGGGSVADKVVGNAKTPVLVVPGQSAIGSIQRARVRVSPRPA
jgi:nucleotide-binding universal stress UspA family protein